MTIMNVMAAPPRRKTSFEVDFDKLDAAREILGTKTLTETVDAALDEVVEREQRRKLVEMLHTPGLLALNDPDVMAGAWR
jgi:putative antitoxin of VapBC-like toxin-antitoxin system